MDTLKEQSFEASRAGIDRGVIERTEHNLLFAEVLDNAEVATEIEEIDKKHIVSALERRKWGHIFNNLNTGDRVVSVLSDTTDLMSIKNLNDNILGPLLTDNLIMVRRNLLGSFLKAELAQNGIDVDTIPGFHLEQNYKFSMFKLPATINVDIEQVFHNVCVKTDAELRETVNDLLGTALKDDPSKADKFEFFKQALAKQGYRMNFGVATVDQAQADSEEQVSTLTAVNSSLQTARAAALLGEDKYGHTFSPEKIHGTLQEIEAIMDGVFADGNTLKLKSGEEIVIFADKKTGGLNRDLLRDVRKNKVEVDPADEKKLADLKRYVKCLNVFDLVKPFTVDEIKEVAAGLEQKKTIAKKIERGETGAAKEAAEILRSSDKDARFSSEATFHSRALSMDDCAYLSLDVLDVGVDQLLDFEQKAYEVLAGKRTLQSVSLEAGDTMTKRLREIRGTIFDILKESNLVDDNRADALVGGDEITLAIDLSKINERDLKKMVTRLKRETNSRVVKTVIAKSERHQSPDRRHSRLTEHLTAIKKAEEGSKVAKEIEEAIRKQKQLDPTNKILKSARVNNFVVTENDNRFVVVDGDGEDFEIADFLNSLKLEGAEV